MLTHCVFFWAQGDLAPADVADFEAGLHTLLAIPTVISGTVGVPATTDRPSVDRTYSHALMLTFADVAGHDAYQVHPIHNAFHKRCVQYWRKATVYDFVDRPNGS
ncbi:MAG: Dabb family protein [Pseudomonadota bacterium]